MRVKHELHLSPILQVRAYAYQETVSFPATDRLLTLIMNVKATGLRDARTRARRIRFEGCSPEQSTAFLERVQDRIPQNAEMCVFHRKSWNEEAIEVTKEKARI